MSTITLAVAQGYSETSQSSRRLDRSNLADFAADVFASDAAGSATVQPGATCGVGPTILDIDETDGSWVSYSITSAAGQYGLERRVCDGVDPGSGDAVVRRIGSAAATAVPNSTGSTCPSGAGVTCTLKLTWNDNQGSFVLSGTRRAG